LAIHGISSAMKAKLLAVLGWLCGRGVDLGQWYLMCVGASSLLTRCVMISFHFRVSFEPFVVCFPWDCPMGIVIHFDWFGCSYFVLGGDVLSWSIVLRGVHSWGCPVGVMVRWTDLTGGGLLHGVLSWDCPMGVMIRWIVVTVPVSY